MNYYKLIISYDGTDFFGWQSQKHCVSIQTTMKECFLYAFARPCTIFAASRTDTGVHAKHQVAYLQTEVGIPADKLREVFNSALPAAIKVEFMEKTLTRFNPHENIAHKIYHYRFYLNKPCPMVARFGWLPPAAHKVNWIKFEAAMKMFVGRHNFTAFCRLEEGEFKETVRSIDNIKCSWQSDLELVVKIQAHSFLRYQIRRMVGAAFEVARKKAFDLSVLQASLASGSTLPAQIAFNAPASGLCLEEIVYKK